MLKFGAQNRVLLRLQLQSCNFITSQSRHVKVDLIPFADAYFSAPRTMRRTRLLFTTTLISTWNAATMSDVCVRALFTYQAGIIQAVITIGTLHCRFQCSRDLRTSGRTYFGPISVQYYFLLAFTSC